MKKHIRLLLSVLFCIPAFAGCTLRLLQLLRYTDSDTGLLTTNGRLSYIIYALLAVSLVAGAVYSSCSKPVLPVIEGNRKYAVIFPVMAASFMLDFIHQCINCYRYIEEAQIIEYNYIIPLIMSCICALLCCLYFVTAYLTVKRTYYDFTRFNLMHICTIVWAFMRLMVMMSGIMDFSLKPEGTCEFLFLTSAICFFLKLLSAIYEGEASVDRICTFTAISTFILAVITALPRLLAMTAGKSAMLSSGGFTLTTYISLGIFALCIATGEGENKTNTLGEQNIVY